MAFIFTLRSTSTDSDKSMHHQQNSAGTLPAISENDGASFEQPRSAPPIPVRALGRPRKNLFSYYTYESPPPYTFDSSGIIGPNGEKFDDVRKGSRSGGGLAESKFIAKRGGWKRLALIVLVALLCIVGLVVGLVVGLRHNRHESSPENSQVSAGGASGTVNGPGNPATNTTFPSGSYRIDTVLTTQSTNCTSNSATWLCYPYYTYSQSAPQSSATFDWIISPGADFKNYTISSTQNPFSIVFSNISMSLENEGQDDEYYFFQTNTQKPTKPTSQLGSANVAATCYFNQTSFQGYLYTKIAKTFSVNQTSGTDDSFAPWPYAVRVEQIASAAPNSPTCVGPSGNSLGNFAVSDGAQVCECMYENTGT